MATIKKNPYEKLQVLLFGSREQRGLDYEEWAARADMHPRTLRRKLDNPGKMSLDELRCLSRIVGISSDDLRTAFPQL